MGERFSRVRVTASTRIFARSCSYKRNNFTWAIRNLVPYRRYSKPFGFCNLSAGASNSFLMFKPPFTVSRRERWNRSKSGRARPYGRLNQPVNTKQVERKSLERTHNSKAISLGA